MRRITAALGDGVSHRRLSGKRGVWCRGAANRVCPACPGQPHSKAEGPGARCDVECPRWRL